MIIIILTLELNISQVKDQAISNWAFSQAMVDNLYYFRYYQEDKLYSQIIILALGQVMAGNYSYSQYWVEQNFQVVEINFTFIMAGTIYCFPY